MTDTNRPALFDEAHPEPGVPQKYLDGDTVERWLFGPVSDEELTEIRSRQEDADPAAWVFPAHPLPAAYRAFLRWSNGGSFVTGVREFQMLKVEELREYLLLYEFPRRMPGAVPFALDGAGGFYLFDLRRPADEAGECPILYTRGDRLVFDDAADLGPTLAAVFRGGSNPADGLAGP